MRFFYIYRLYIYRLVAYDSDNYNLLVSSGKTVKISPSRK